MCTNCVDKLVEIFNSIISKETNDITWVSSFEKQVSTLSMEVKDYFGSVSLEAEFADELLGFIKMSKLVPSGQKLKEWLEFGVPKLIDNIKRKLAIITEGFFSFAS